jgi:D-alanyl-D-alanine carboxypeptidase/D-alanyl-D-alanine-endopeptidase (penicillin-binding protein 4)
MRRTPRVLPRLLAWSALMAVLVAGTTARPVAPAAAAISDPALATKVRTLMKDWRVQQARSSTLVLDATSGSTLYSRYGSRSTTPASNTKIATAAAAMHVLGPDYRFKTEVVRRGKVVNGTLRGNLYLKGFGDPTTLRSDFQALARSVAAKGIRRVSSKLVADASFFDSVRYSPYWSTGYASDYYAAQISALTAAPNADYDAGTVIVGYRAGTVGSRAKITVTPATAARYLTIRNDTRTGSRGSSDSVSMSRSLGTNVVTVSGRVPAGGSGREWVTVHRPDLYAAALFRAELGKAGVRVDGVTTAATVPSGSRTVIARDRSMRLSALLVPFMKLSNNMHAEALTKAMAVKAGRAGTWANGLALTKAYLRSRGVPMTGVVLNDGSGLTRTNKLTTRALGVLLHRVQRESWFPAFYASLPVAGASDRMTGGTLRSRMRGTRAAGNAHAKTGSLTGVTALSGYVRGRNGRLYIFSMLSQYSGTSPRPVEDKVVVTLANHSG